MLNRVTALVNRIMDEVSSLSPVSCPLASLVCVLIGSTSPYDARNRFSKLAKSYLAEANAIVTLMLSGSERSHSKSRDKPKQRERAGDGNRGQGRRPAARGDHREAQAAEQGDQQH